MTAPNCPDREALSDFCSGILAADLADEMADHVERCAQCEALVNEIESGGVALVAPLRESKAEGGFLAEPQLEFARGRVESLMRQSRPLAAGSLAGPSELHPLAAIGTLGQLRDYRLLGVLGRGGMGTVYKALHTRLDKLVAVKLLTEERTRDAQAVARFEREMKAVGKLQHPHIVSAHDAGEAEGRHFLAMEYVEGLNLADLVRRVGPLAVADACELVRQAALGLEYAHQHALVHRDVKPSNLMLTADGQVKILDLGLARLHDDTVVGGELTETSQVMGTTDYMAPEQATETHTVDGRADIYSLGCTLYKLLVGEAPFGGDRYRLPAQKLLAHVQTPPPSVAQRRIDVPDDLAAVVARTLAKSPMARYATAGDLAAALATFASGSDLRALYAFARERDYAVCVTTRDELVPDSQDIRTLDVNDALERAGVPASGNTVANFRSPYDDTPPLVAAAAQNTASLTPPLIAGSAEAEQTKSLTTSPVQLPPGAGKRWFLASAGAAALFLGVVIVIKMRDGSSTTIKVDGDVDQVTVDKKPVVDAIPINSDRAAAEWVLAKGGRIDVITNGEPRPVTAATDLPTKTFRVSSVDLRDIDTLTDDDLLCLQGLTDIQVLDLGGTSVGNAGLVHIAGLKSLRHLILRATRVTEAGFETIAGLTNLEGLSIEYTAFHENGLGELAALPKLKYLQAPSTLAVGDAGLSHLRQLTHLEHVSIIAADATSAGWAFVDDLPALETLDLLTTPVNESGLTHIAQAPRLKWLRFSDAGITVEGWRVLLSLSRLKGLHVMGHRIGDRDLVGIAQLTGLDDLMLSDYLAGDAGLNLLGKMTNLKLLHIDPCESITDAGLMHLDDMSKLRELKLIGSKVSPAAIERLKKALPDCKISH